MNDRAERKGLSGSTLKLIAVFIMLIDHIGAVILGRLLLLNGFGSMKDAAEINVWMQQNGMLFGGYNIMRQIGRMAFPIFCFLLIEGFEHTRDRKKYALRLSIFALLSEVPFDLALKGSILEFSHQNVFFTLLIGLLTIMAMDAIEQNRRWNPLVSSLLLAGAILGGMAAAILLRTDYDMKGILCIVVLYLFRKKRSTQLIAGSLSFIWWEPTAVFAFILIALYNGKRGWNMKYLFYLFYPLHLLILFLICYFMGITGVPAL